MRVTGVICEYNPFHGGHMAQLQKIREKSEADYIIAVMSGDFVQRGEPAIYDKATRAKAALLAGADLVIEMPVLFSTASAPDFAAAGIAALDGLGVVTDLCFGSECGDIAPLMEAADVLLDEPEIFKDTIMSSLRSGDTYAKAQAKALAASLEHGSCTDMERYADIFSSPNNVLGIEYLRSLRSHQSSIKPFTLKREGQGYNDDSPEHLISDVFPSASAIRKAVRKENFDYFGYLYETLSSSPCLPPDMKSSLKDILPPAHPIFADDLSTLLDQKLLEVSRGKPIDMTAEALAAFSGLSPDLARRLARRVTDFDTFTGRVAALKSRSYTYARVSRALLHIVLEITDDDVRLAKENGYITYIRVLGFRRTSEELLGEIHKNSSLPMITKTAGAAESLSADGKSCFFGDLYASHLYQSLVFETSDTRLLNEYTRPVIII